ncbi:hypothetical protein D3C86_1464110 [compost metagenome]
MCNVLEAGVAAIGATFFKMTLGTQYLVELANHVHRQPHRAGLVHDRALDALADPPRGIGGKAEATGRIKLLDGVHQAEVAFLDQIEQRHATIQIALGDAHHEAQVALDHYLPRREIPALGQRGEMEFLRRGQQRLDADAVQVVLDGVSREFRVEHGLEVVVLGRGLGGFFFLFLVLGFLVVALVGGGDIYAQIGGEIGVTQAGTRNGRDRLVGGRDHFGGRIVAKDLGVHHVGRFRHTSLSFRLLGTTGPADNSG